MKDKNKYWIKNFFGFAILRRSDGKLVRHNETSGFCLDYTDEDIRSDT